MAELAPGASFGEFRIEQLVGHGGMGLVYKARQERLGRSVALKVIAPHLAQDAGFRERFRRESQMAAAIDHPNILPIYDAGEVDGQPYLAMRFVDGTDLRAVIDAEAPLHPDRVAAIADQVAHALDAAHTRGLIHRDVKPANILLTGGSGGREIVYLTDFGLTRGRSDTRLTQTGAWIGTVDYMAPEQFESDAPVDARVDQYSLACVTYEALTGKRPFERDTDVQVMFAHIRDEPPAATVARPQLPAAVDDALLRGMAKRPGDRFETCAEFATALRRALAVPIAPPPIPPTVVGAAATATGGGAGSDAPTAPSPTVVGRRRTNPALVGGGVAVAAIGIVAAVVAATGGGGEGTTTATTASTPTTATTATAPTTTTTPTTPTTPDDSFPPTSAAGVLELINQPVSAAIIYDAATGGERAKLRIAANGAQFGMLYRTATEEVRTLTTNGALQWACLRQGKGQTNCLRARAVDAKTRRSLEDSIEKFRNVVSNEGLAKLFAPIALAGAEVLQDRQVEREVACIQARYEGQRARVCVTRAGYITEVLVNTKGSTYVLRATSLKEIERGEFQPPARLLG